MKIKLTLRGRTREDIDLLVTTDATATVGDVAAALASSGPRQSAATLAAPDSLRSGFSIPWTEESPQSCRQRHT